MIPRLVMHHQGLHRAGWCRFNFYLKHPFSLVYPSHYTYWTDSKILYCLSILKSLIGIFHVPLVFDCLLEKLGAKSSEDSMALSIRASRDRKFINPDSILKKDLQYILPRQIVTMRFSKWMQCWVAGNVYVVLMI